MRIMSIPVIATVTLGSALAAPLFWMTPVMDETFDDATPIAVEPYQPTWKCEDCSPEEKYVLKELQEKTKISDRNACLLYTSPSPRDATLSRMPSSA